MSFGEDDLGRWYREEVLVHEQALRAYLKHAFPSVPEVEDVVPEAVARVVEARRRGPIAAIKSYLFATARNAAMDFLRRRQVVRIDGMAEIESLSVLDEGRSVPELVDTRLDLEILKEAISALPDRCRQVLTLRKLHRLSQREIAARLGISENTVESQISIGMRQCRAFFGKRGLLKRKEAGDEQE